MAYATIDDIRSRMTAELSADQERLCAKLLADVAVLIDAVAPKATSDQKRVVSCSVVVRAITTTGADNTVPVGATQGSMSALGYSQSWTVGGGGAVGELYLSRTEKRILGVSTLLDHTARLKMSGRRFCERG